MVLEIINSCVTNTLHHNPNLVYTLLHRRELFAQFRTHPTFHDIIQNIDTVSPKTIKSESFDTNSVQQFPKPAFGKGVARTFWGRCDAHFLYPDLFTNCPLSEEKSD